VFFNYGKRSGKASYQRHSRYFKAWTIATGELPRKYQKIFQKSLFDDENFEVQVGTSTIDSDGRSKQDAEAYSRVTETIYSTHPNHRRSQSTSRITRIRPSDNYETGSTTDTGALSANPMVRPYES
jgi:exopolysaccharide biosynthesis protein